LSRQKSRGGYRTEGPEEINTNKENPSGEESSEGERSVYGKNRRATSGARERREARN